MKPLTLAYSMADQALRQTQSVGIFNVSLGLLQALLRTDKVYRLAVLANRTLPLSQPAAERVSIHWYDAPVGRRAARLWWDQFGVYRAAAATGMEWLFLPKGFASFLTRCPLRLAAYVHDTMPFYYRERYPRAYWQCGFWYFRRCLLATLRRAQAIFTLTEFSRQNLLTVGTRLCKKMPPVAVAGIGFDPPEYPIPSKENLVVCLASPWPHKLTTRAVDFLERWRRRCRFTGSIVVVGSPPLDLVRPSAPVWSWHERMPTEKFESLLSTARVLVYFSDMEGFGMPPVEAVLRGTCPVFSDIPALREVMGEAGVAFTNGDFSSFEASMEKAFSVSPEQMSEWKKTLLARHNWDNVLARILPALE